MISEFLDWLIDAVPSVNLARKSAGNKKPNGVEHSKNDDAKDATTLHRIKPK